MPCSGPKHIGDQDGSFVPHAASMKCDSFGLGAQVRAPCTVSGEMEGLLEELTFKPESEERELEAGGGRAEDHGTKL